MNSIVKDIFNEYSEFLGEGFKSIFTTATLYKIV